MTIEIPERMKRLARDSRGFPIPYVQFLDANGVPDFRVIDDRKMQHALRFKLCGLCGVPMGKHVYFVGGPACVQYGAFYDPPMHHDCAMFALRTCPHLARSKGRYAEPTPRGDMTGAKLVVGTMDTDKCEWFALMHTTGFEVGRTPEGMLLIRAKLPWLDVERWKDGVVLP